MVLSRTWQSWVLLERPLCDAHAVCIAVLSEVEYRDEEPNLARLDGR